MSKSHKARHGTKTKLWKDTVYDSRCQVQAHSKKKRRRARKARRTGKAAVQAMALRLLVGILAGALEET